jgi:hypothetical protein
LSETNAPCGLPCVGDSLSAASTETAAPWPGRENEKNTFGIAIRPTTRIGNAPASEMTVTVEPIDACS